jgi:hypothetical protein
MSAKRRGVRYEQSGLLGTALAVGLAASYPVGQAQACGGLFCSAANPVNQAAERIIFAFDKAQQKVTAVVEILYEGPAENFAWVLPVPGIPEVDVSTSSLLDRLQSATNPNYAIQRSWGGRCGNPPPLPTAAPAPAAPPQIPGAGAQGPSVSVLASGSVGPYNFEVIKVEPANSDPADVAIAWLKTNGYDVGALGPDVLRPYLRDGLNLIAFRLSKNRNAGSIRPVMLTYTSQHPMIPIRPTAVAANDDMGILVWVLGRSRAVPTNYKTLEINEAYINWFSPSNSYNDVISAAADEAGGQGFVTELAAPIAARSLDSSIFPESSQIEQFRQSADQLSDAELVAQSVGYLSIFPQGGFGGPFAPRAMNGPVALDGLTDVLVKHLTLPAGVTVEQLLASPRCHFQELRPARSFYCEGRPAPAESISLARFDRLAFLRDLEKLVIQPLEKTVQLFASQRYVTRLYTTMSARDMTLDPEFDLNTQLPDVDNNHSVMLKYLDTCFGDVSGRWEATLESGQVVAGRDSTWPMSLQSQNMPVNRRVLQLSATGPGLVIQDNTTMVGGTPVPVPPGTAPVPTPGGRPAPMPGTTVPPTTVPGAGPDQGGGCALAPGNERRPAAGGALLGLGLAAALAARGARRRREQRSHLHG